MKNYTFYYTDKIIATFTFLTPRTKRNLFSASLLHTVFTYPFMHSRGYLNKSNSYDEETRLIYINFVIALVHNKLNLHLSKFNNYGEVLKFLEGFKGDKLFSKSYISVLKLKGQFKKVPLTEKSEEFILYVKKRFPSFDEAGFVFQPTDTLHLDKSKTLQTITPSKNRLFSKSINEENQHIYKPKPIKLSYTYTLFFKLMHSIITLTLIFIPYFVLFLFTAKDLLPELLDLTKEIETDLELIKARPYVYGYDYTGPVRTLEAATYTDKRHTTPLNKAFLDNIQSTLQQNPDIANNKHIFNKST